MKQVKLTEKFLDELKSITTYIIQNSQSETPGMKFYEKMVNSVMNLKDYPEIGVIPRYRALRLKEYRVLIVENYLLFYRVEGDIVMVYHIVHAKQDYKSLI